VNSVCVFMQEQNWKKNAMEYGRIDITAWIADWVTFMVRNKRMQCHKNHASMFTP